MSCCERISLTPPVVRLLLQLLLLHTLAVPAAHASWLMPLPAELDGQTITDITVSTDGVELEGAPATLLADELATWLNQATLLWLQQQAGLLVSPQELAGKGITLSLDTRRLVLSLSLSPQAASLQALTMGNPLPTPLYDDSANWTVQSTFNLSAAGQSSPASASAVSTSDNSLHMAWLGSANADGYLGPNLDWSLNVSHQSLSHGETDTRLQRGPLQLFFDNPDHPWRLSLGDISSARGGHLPQLKLGGMRWSNSYRHLQPYRQLGPGGSQVIELEESATVSVYLNGRYYQRLQLLPGRYQLDDLPLSSGSNDVRLVLDYTSGRQQELQFSQFYNASLLRTGFSEAAVAVGLVDDTPGAQYQYQGPLLISGDYALGLNPDVTLGASGLVSDSGYQLGIRALSAVSVGNISGRGSVMHYPDQAGFGGILSMDFAFNLWDGKPHGSPNLRISSEWLAHYRPLPWSQDQLVDGWQLRFDHHSLLSERLSLNLGGSIGEQQTSSSGSTAEAVNQEQAQEFDHQASVTLHWSLRQLRVSVGSRYQRSDAQPDGELLGLLSFSWSTPAASSQQVVRSGFDYQGHSDQATGHMELGRLPATGINQWGYQAGLSKSPGEQSQQLSGRYLANRWRGQASVSSTQQSELSDGADDLTAARNSIGGRASLSTSLVVADGRLGWGNSGRGAQAVILAHPTLEEARVEISGQGNDQPLAYATRRAGALLPLSSHRPGRLLLNVPDAPPGYDWGPGQYELVAGSRTGHVIEIGSDSARTVIGTLLKRDGKPVSLLQGTATALDNSTNNKPVPFFTNRGGRFVLEGVAPGRYRLQLNADRLRGTMITVPDDAGMLIYLPEVKL